MAVITSLTPCNSHDSSCASITSSAGSSRSRKSPNLRHHHNNKTARGSPASSTNNKNPFSINVVSVLRVIVLASSLIFLLVCVLQSQHLVLENDGGVSQSSVAGEVGGNADTLAGRRREWKLKDSGFVRSSSRSGGVGSFHGGIFQTQLQKWRQETHRIQQHSRLSKLRPQQQSQQQPPLSNKASPTSRLLTAQSANATVPLHRQQSPVLSIPFWEQQAIFRRRNTWHLMVTILAEDCVPYYTDNHQPSNTPKYPTLVTLQDALQTHHADIVVYFPQPPKSTLFSQVTEKARQGQQLCQATLQSMIRVKYASNLERGQLQLVEGIVNPLPPRIQYNFHHEIASAMADLQKQKLEGDALTAAQSKARIRLEYEQLQLETDYSLGLDFAYLSELVYEYGDLFFFLRAGTKFSPEMAVASTTASTSTGSTGGTAVDYGWQIVQQYEGFQERLEKDLLVHRFCYMSFLKEDEWAVLPGPNTTAADLPPRYQKTLRLPSAILMEKHGLYRLSMVLRSILPYHKESTAGLLSKYCEDLLWEAQSVQPINAQAFVGRNDTDPSMFPPSLFTYTEPKLTKAKDANANANVTVPPVTEKEEVVPQVAKEVIDKQLERIQQQHSTLKATIPGWVTVDNKQLGPQRYTNPGDLYELPDTVTPPPVNITKERKLVTFVIPTSTRPNGVKNQYVTFSLNQLFPLIRRDFMHPVTKQLKASVLLVICGNTQEDLDDHQNGLWEYYGPEIKEGILEIVATNLETYPSLHNLPNNYNDPENRLRWRSKQNLDISSSFYAAKGKSDYIMLLEDDTGYRDKFTPTLKALIESDKRQEGNINPAPKSPDDFRNHIFAQVHFGFGYSGVLIHDDDALVYAVMHFVLMDEKPCDLLFLANFLQGQVLDQKWRWQMKRVLLTHLGGVSSLKGKFQPVWGLKG